jgi:hypothetical protein
MFIWQSFVCTYMFYLYVYSDSLFSTRFVGNDHGTVGKTALCCKFLCWAIAVGNIFKWMSRMQVDILFYVSYYSFYLQWNHLGYYGIWLVSLCLAFHRLPVSLSSGVNEISGTTSTHSLLSEFIVLILLWATLGTAGVVRQSVITNHVA